MITKLESSFLVAFKTQTLYTKVRIKWSQTSNRKDQVMKDQRVVTLAKNLIDYSLELKPGERLWIETRGFPVLEMAKEMITQCTKVGAVPFW
ncbi:MAG: hypothetical protein AMJ73_08955, partial [candidate division Zixibacteria bacterium SM1_73]